MITPSILIGIAFSHVAASPLKAAITGDLYKRNRPQNSEKEDIVFNSLPITNEAVQNAIINMNIFVPDLMIEFEGRQQRQPDNAQIEFLEQLATEVIGDIDATFGDQHVMYEIQQVHVFKDNESNQHYINLRLEFFTTNI